jgi:transposase
MAEPLVADALWALIAPLLPERPPRPKVGRPPVDDHKALAGRHLVRAQVRHPLGDAP